MRKILKKIDVTIVFKSTNEIKDTMKSVKDKKHKQHTIHCIHSSCESVNIGIRKDLTLR